MRGSFLVEEPSTRGSLLLKKHSVKPAKSFDLHLQDKRIQGHGLHPQIEKGSR